MNKLQGGCIVAALAAAMGAPSTVSATVPYGSLSGGIPGTLGPGLPLPSIVPGKEYSHNLDQNTTGAGGVLDPSQVIAWDGSGGTADGVDYGRAGEVDAIANRRDHLFNQLIGPDPSDTAHLIFSHDDMISVYPPTPGASFVPFIVPSAGPVVISNGNAIGGAGELSYELAGAFSAPSTQGVWAPQPSVNLMPLPRDVDGVEVWGPEPAFTADADKYSLDLDFTTGTSVWNDPGGTPYIPHASIVAAVTSLLGPVSGVLPYPDFIDGEDAVNLDALMVQDVVGDKDSFDRDPAGGIGDRIIFSIRQIVDPLDPTGYYATGSELFVMDASLGPAGTVFLAHGGHLWDKAYAISDLSLPPGLINDARGVIDINAIEAISEGVVPEPSTIVLLALAGLGICGASRRRSVR